MEYLKSMFARTSPEDLKAYMQFKRRNPKRTKVRLTENKSTKKESFEFS